MYSLHAKSTQILRYKHLLESQTIVDSKRFSYNFEHNFYLVNRYHQIEMENIKGIANTIASDIARENELNLKLGKNFQCLLRYSFESVADIHIFSLFFIYR